jgi:hypothetical protein
MGEILETAQHDFWGRMQRRAGYEGWDIEFTDSLPDGRAVRIRVDLADPNDERTQSNYSAIRKRWDELWSRILIRTQEMKTRYGYGTVEIDIDSDWFSLSPPREPIECNPEWSVMLQATEAGWLLDFRGWEDAGGQGVF